MAFYLRTHNGRRTLGTQLSEFPHAPVAMLKRTRCRDGSVNETYECGCVINRTEPGLKPTVRESKRTTTPTRRASWLQQMMED